MFCQYYYNIYKLCKKFYCNLMFNLLIIKIYLMNFKNNYNILFFFDNKDKI